MYQNNTHIVEVNKYESGISIHENIFMSRRPVPTLAGHEKELSCLADFRLQK